MAVAIVYYKQENNKIRDFFNNVTEITSKSVRFEEGYTAEFDEPITGILVTDSVTVEYGELPEDAEILYRSPSHLVDKDGNIINRGDILPEGLNNLNKHFLKKTLDELQKELEVTQKALDFLLMNGGM